MTLNMSTNGSVIGGKKRASTPPAENTTTPTTTTATTTPTHTVKDGGALILDVTPSGTPDEYHAHAILAGGGYNRDAIEGAEPDARWVITLTVTEVGHDTPDGFARVPNTTVNVYLRDVYTRSGKSPIKAIVTRALASVLPSEAKANAAGMTATTAIQAIIGAVNASRAALGLAPISGPMDPSCDPATAATLRLLLHQ